MKTRKFVTTIVLFFTYLTSLRAGILSENISWYRTLNSAESLVLGIPKTRTDKLKRICYIETHSVYAQTPAKNIDDRLLREVSHNFQTLWDYPFNDLLWGIPVINNSSVLVVNGNHPRALVLFWIIRKRIDLLCDALTPATKKNIQNFSSYHKIMLKIANKALRELNTISDDATYEALSDDAKLKEAYHRLEISKDYLDYPKCIVQLLEE